MKGVIWDLDGCLIDAQEIHRTALEKALVAVDLMDYAVIAYHRRPELEGLPTKRKLEILRVPMDLRASVNKEKQRLTLEAAGRYPVDEDRFDLLHWLVTNGFQTACVTNSIRATAERFLVSAGLFQHLDLLLTNEDVEKAKPSPEGYLKAMCDLGLSPNETLIVEDSDVGLLSARASGAKVLEVTFETVSLDLIRSHL